MTEGKEVRQSCSEAFEIKIVRREEGVVRNTVGILVKKRGDVRGGYQTLTWAGRGMDKTDNHPETDSEKRGS